MAYVGSTSLEITNLKRLHNLQSTYVSNEYSWQTICFINMACELIRAYKHCHLANNYNACRYYRFKNVLWMRSGKI